ncbi:MAG: phosphomannomutase/phosphoglucomutase [Burkholderiaceae bacterium]
MGIFHAYDVRGVYGETLTTDLARRIGYFLPRLLDTSQVLVGQDARESSPALFEALSAGITLAGADVTSLGLCTTPMVYFHTARKGFDASVCITASHNPARYNGFKVSTTDSRPVGYESGLGQLEQWVNDVQGEPMTPAARPGSVRTLDGKSEYLDFLATLEAPSGELSMAIDCSNGMAGLLAREVFGPDPDYLYDTIDCTFPNHPPDPSNPSTLEVLREAVLTGERDLGMVFDGDADRVMFLDERGRFVPPDLIIAVLGLYFHQKGVADPLVLQDVRTSKAVSEFLAPLGGTVQTWKVGRAFAARRLREINGLVGGELAGHYYFRDFAFSDSAMLAALRVIDVVAAEKRAGRRFSELIDQIRRYSGSGEINFELTAKQAAMDAVKSYFVTHEHPEAVHDFDGYRLEFSDWWFCIRQSNTEPLLRLVVEAQGQDQLDQRVAQIRAIIEEHRD